MIAALPAAFACGDEHKDAAGPTPAGEPAGTPNVLTISPSQAAVWSPSVTFYAVKGKKRQASLYLRAPDGGISAELARLEIKSRSLVTGANGAPLAHGDSVLITLSLVNPDLLEFELLPRGLQFDQHHPARLRVDYGAANPDYTGDGHVDQSDDRAERRIAVWRLTSLGETFTPLPTERGRTGKSVEADLPDFSRYAIAY